MSITLTLEDGYANVIDLRSVAARAGQGRSEYERFAINMRQIGKVPPMRVIQVDLDYVYDADAERKRAMSIR